jgi:hypothetical protein
MPNAEVWPANTLIAEKYPKIPASDEANDDEDALTSARTRHAHQTGPWKATDPNQVLLTPRCDFHLIVAPTTWSASHYVHHENATRKPSWTATETACAIFHVHHHNTNREVTRYWLSNLFVPYMAPIGSMPAHSRKTGGRRFEAYLYTVNTRPGCWMEISILFKDNGRSRTWRNWNNSGFSVDAYLRAGTPPETKRLEPKWLRKNICQWEGLSHILRKIKKMKPPTSCIVSFCSRTIIGITSFPMFTVVLNKIVWIDML